MEEYSLITRVKIDLLRYGVYFEPLDLFSKYKEKYKIKKINVKPTIVGDAVFDLDETTYVLPSEVILMDNGRKSICKLRFSKDSNIRIDIKDDKIVLYKNGNLVPICIEMVKKYDFLCKKTGININGIDTVVGDFVDVVGLDRISILFFEGCYNWNCGKACKFCDLHPKQKKDLVIKPTINNLSNYDNVNDWWNYTRNLYFEGIRISLTEVLKYFDNDCHIFFMAGNLPTLEDVWNVSEDLIRYLSKYFDFNKYDTYLNIAPHDSIEKLKKIKNYGIKQVQYNLEVANKVLFGDICPGKINYDLFLEKLVEAVHIMGFGNVRSNFVFGLQSKNELVDNIRTLACRGIVADYSVFQPKKNTPFQNRKGPDFNDVIEFTDDLVNIYYQYKFKPIFCSLSSRSSIVNEVYDDKYK